MSRLSLDFAELAVGLARAPADRRSRAAAAAAIAAIDHTQLQDPTIATARRALEAPGTCEPRLRDLVEGVVRRLDEIYFDAQETDDASEQPPVGVTSAFAQARAANAVWFALAADSVSDAQDAVYEAHYALDDRERLCSIVADALG